MKKLLVSVVAYKSPDMTIGCLASLEPEIRDHFPGSRVVVVDNCSGDGSAEAVEAAIREGGWEGWAEVIKAPRNGGYAYGNNLAIRSQLDSGKGVDYFLLLNPDTLVRPGALVVLADFLEKNPRVGIAGSRSEDPDGTPQVCCFRFGSVLNELASNAKLGVLDRLLKGVISRVPLSETAHQIDWVSGAAMLIRPEVLRDVGLMDERYFLYFEESDLCFRARQAGWLCWHVPQSRIVHLVGTSTGVTKRDGAPRRRPTYWFESRRRYFLKHHGALRAIAADGAAILGQMLWKVRVVLQRKQDTSPPHLLGDLIRNSVLVKGTRIEKEIPGIVPAAAPVACSSASAAAD